MPERRYAMHSLSTYLSLTKGLNRDHIAEQFRITGGAGTLETSFVLLKKR
jgi:hypothetical protein